VHSPQKDGPLLHCLRTAHLLPITLVLFYMFSLFYILYLQLLLYQ